MPDNLFHNMDLDLFMRCITEAKDRIDETELMFLDDPERGACIIGYIARIIINEKMTHFPPHYWIGSGCDLKDGAEFSTAGELLSAKVYGGRSIAQAWDKVCVLNLGTMPLDIWFSSCPFAGDVIEENGVWKLRR